MPRVITDSTTGDPIGMAGGNSLTLIETNYPDTLIMGVVGRRLSALIEHPALMATPIIVRSEILRMDTGMPVWTIECDREILVS